MDVGSAEARVIVKMVKKKKEKNARTYAYICLILYA
jgi:hypothetical protein